jgi:hypothetical protein
MASTPGDIQNATQLAVVYEYQARRRDMLRDYSGAVESYRRSTAICEPVIEAHPDHQPCARQLVINGGQLARLYAFLSDRTQARSTAAAMLERATTVASSGSAAATTYLPRGLAWSGDVYATLAADPHAPKAQRMDDWAQAASFYRRAQAKWKGVPPEMRSQFVKEEQRVRDRLAESERETKK